MWVILSGDGWASGTFWCQSVWAFRVTGELAISNWIKNAYPALRFVRDDLGTGRYRMVTGRSRITSWILGVVGALAPQRPSDHPSEHHDAGHNET
jgi:hypothetical protein